MRNHTLIIRPALPQDIPDLMRLIRELAAYEHAEDSVRINEEQLLKDGFSSTPAYQSLIASLDGKTVGFCLYWYRYSTWRGRLLYVEDLYVCEEFRRRGIGKSLLAEAMKTAEKEGIEFISLQVLEWNEPAISFYRRYWNPNFDGEWLNVLIPVK